MDSARCRQAQALSWGNTLVRASPRYAVTARNADQTGSLPGTDARVSVAVSTAEDRKVSRSRQLGRPSARAATASKRKWRHSPLSSASSSPTCAAKTASAATLAKRASENLYAGPRPPRKSFPPRHCLSAPMRRRRREPSLSERDFRGQSQPPQPALSAGAMSASGAPRRRGSDAFSRQPPSPTPRPDSPPMWALGVTLGLSADAGKSPTAGRPRVWARIAENTVDDHSRQP